MAKETSIEVKVLAFTDSALQARFYEDEPEQTDLWVPLSLIEDQAAEAIEAYTENPSNDVHTITMQKWFLKKNDVPYDSEN